MPVNTILFDLGNTLIYPKEPWPPIFERADQALIQVLQDAEIPLDTTLFCNEYGTFIETYYGTQKDDLTENTSLNLLRELLEKQGFQSIQNSLLQSAINALHIITRANWQVEDDAVSTLKMLKEAGYRLGLISNTSDDQNVQYQVNQWGLRPFFEIVITSAAAGIRKPHPRIFQMALDHFEVPPKQTAMVGDSLYADIHGANQIGITSIWITRRAAETNDSFQPKATIHYLHEIPVKVKTL